MRKIFKCFFSYVFKFKLTIIFSYNFCKIFWIRIINYINSFIYFHIFFSILNPTSNTII